jgi:hypothetical protein
MVPRSREQNYSKVQLLLALGGMVLITLIMFGCVPSTESLQPVQYSKEEQNKTKIALFYLPGSECGKFLEYSIYYVPIYADMKKANVVVSVFPFNGAIWSEEYAQKAGTKLGVDYVYYADLGGVDCKRITAYLTSLKTNITLKNIIDMDQEVSNTEIAEIIATHLVIAIPDIYTAATRAREDIVTPSSMPQTAPSKQNESEKLKGDLDREKRKIARLKKLLEEKTKQIAVLTAKRVKLEDSSKIIDELRDKLAQSEARLKDMMRKQNELNEKLKRAQAKIIDSKKIALSRARNKLKFSLHSDIRPRLFVLAVGVSDYRDKSLKLRFAAKDAILLSETFKMQPRILYESIETKVLIDNNATRENIIIGLVDFLGRATSNDVVIIFVAGHGIKRLDTGTFYFLPYDATEQSLLTRGLRWTDFEESVKIISQRVKNVVLILDTCHAGSLQIGLRGIKLGYDLSTPFNRRGIFVLSATQPHEQAHESKEWQHGAFTYAVVEGIKGEADFDKDKIIDTIKLFHYVERRVVKMTNGKQHPRFQMGGGSLPIGVIP